MTGEEEKGREAGSSEEAELTEHFEHLPSGTEVESPK